MFQIVHFGGSSHPPKQLFSQFLVLFSEKAFNTALEKIVARFFIQTDRSGKIIEKINSFNKKLKLWAPVAPLNMLL